MRGTKVSLRATLLATRAPRNSWPGGAGNTFWGFGSHQGEAIRVTPASDGLSESETQSERRVFSLYTLPQIQELSNIHLFPLKFNSNLKKRVFLILDIHSL